MPKTLLLADDSVVIQKLVGLSFANEDVELVTTDNGDDAMARARELKPQLILADVVMPGLSGYEVCQAVKQDPELSGTPVLLLTGTFEAFDEERAREVGADGHITKPFEAQALVVRVNELLDAAPAAEVPIPPQSSPAASDAESFDFFDDEIDQLAPIESTSRELEVTAEEEPFALTDDESDALDPIDSLLDDGPALETELETAELSSTDQTIALMPEPLASDWTAEADQPTATVISETLEADVEDSFGSRETAPLVPEPERVDPVAESPDLLEPFGSPELADAEDADPLLGDDLFEPEPVVAPAPSTVLETEAADAAFEFSFGGGTNAADLDLGPEIAEDLMHVDPAGVSAYDVSSSDLGSSLVGGVTPPNSDPIESDLDLQDALAASPDPDPILEIGTEPSSTPTPESSVEAPWPQPQDVLGDSEPAATGSPTSTGSTGDHPDLTVLMAERVQETLEKVAWEAFSDLSDKVVKDVLKRVESIAWEVIPQMAETLIREEIRRIKGDQD